LFGTSCVAAFAVCCKARPKYGAAARTVDGRRTQVRGELPVLVCARSWKEAKLAAIAASEAHAKIGEARLSCERALSENQIRKNFPNAVDLR